MHFTLSKFRHIGVHYETSHEVTRDLSGHPLGLGYTTQLCVCYIISITC